MDFDFDVPPISSCLVCGQPACAGCVRPEPTPPAPLSPLLPFEQTSLGFWARLTDTALLTALEPEHVFGSSLAEARTRPAWIFAVASESLALGSLFALLVSAFAVLFPQISIELFRVPEAWLFCLTLYGLAIAFLVGIHWLWGYVLEPQPPGALPSGEGSGAGALGPCSLGPSSVGPSSVGPSSVGPSSVGPSSVGPSSVPRGSGARFGLYACGWDLITSPAGLLMLLLRLPAGARARALRGALSAPRLAMDAYFRRGLGMDEGEIRRVQRKVMRGGALGFALMFLGLLAAGLALALHGLFP